MKQAPPARGLHVGVDLRRTPDGEWFCFEVNPSPGFTFYEPDDERPIADAIARLLSEGHAAAARPAAALRGPTPS